MTSLSTTNEDVEKYSPSGFVITKNNTFLDKMTHSKFYLILCISKLVYPLMIQSKIKSKANLFQNSLPTRPNWMPCTMNNFHPFSAMRMQFSWLKQKPKYPGAIISKSWSSSQFKRSDEISQFIHHDVIVVCCVVSLLRAKTRCVSFLNFLLSSFLWLHHPDHSRGSIYLSGIIVSGSYNQECTHHIECEWQKSSAEMICRKNFRASFGVSRPFFTRQSNSSPPETCSSTRYLCTCELVCVCVNG